MIVVCPDNRVQWFVGVIQKETLICCIDAEVIGTKREKTCNVVINIYLAISQKQNLQKKLSYRNKITTVHRTTCRLTG